MTGTPGTGKSHFASMLSKSIPELKVIEINEMVNRYHLFSGVDREKTKIVKMKPLERRLRTEAKKVKGPVALVGHLAADLNLKYDISIVTRCELKKLAGRLRKRRYSDMKLNENIVSEALDYCGANSEKKSRELYEVETEKEKAAVLRYLKSRVLGKRSKKPKLVQKRKLNELIPMIKSGSIL